MSEEHLEGLVNEILGTESDEELDTLLRKTWIHNMIGRSDMDVDEEEEDEPVLNADGSVRKVKRLDYSRRRKDKKPGNPWQICRYLLLIRDPTTNDPTSPKGKEFRAKFRTPFPVFEDIVKMCRDSGEHVFNYAEKCVGGEHSIPLELKLLAALRVLACGSGFDLVADACGFMSRTTCNTFFKDFVRLFRLHFADMYIKPLAGARLEGSMGVYAKLGLAGCVGSIDVSALFSAYLLCSACFALQF
jgi:hypothetical protein